MKRSTSFDGFPETFKQGPRNVFVDFLLALPVCGPTIAKTEKQGETKNEREREKDIGRKGEREYEKEEDREREGEQEQKTAREEKERKVKRSV